MLSNSVVKWRWGREGVKDSCIIYCRQQQQHVHSWIAQLSHISSGATCTADLDSEALALTNAQNRPALLQLNRPLGTAVTHNQEAHTLTHRSFKNASALAI